VSVHAVAGCKTSSLVAAVKKRVRACLLKKATVAAVQGLLAQVRVVATTQEWPGSCTPLISQPCVLHGVRLGIERKLVLVPGHAHSLSVVRMVTKGLPRGPTEATTLVIVS
jgi:hypothetical protein